MTTNRSTRRCSHLPAVIICAAMTVFCIGCIYLPFPVRDLDGGIPGETTDQFAAGKTTRADVILRIGPPDIRYDRDRLFIYKWIREAGSFAGLGGGGNTIRVRRGLCILFDSENRLQSYKYVSEPQMVLSDDELGCSEIGSCGEKWMRTSWVSRFIKSCSRDTDSPVVAPEKEADNR